MARLLCGRGISRRGTTHNGAEIDAARFGAVKLPQLLQHIPCHISVAVFCARIGATATTTAVCRAAGIQSTKARHELTGVLGGPGLCAVQSLTSQLHRRSRIAHKVFDLQLVRDLNFPAVHVHQHSITQHALAQLTQHGPANANKEWHGRRYNVVKFRRQGWH